MLITFIIRVSIQPKPKTGLEEEDNEALTKLYERVSIQPKPKTGLEVQMFKDRCSKTVCFNPAEAEDGFRSVQTLMPV